MASARRAIRRTTARTAPRSDDIEHRERVPRHEKEVGSAVDTRARVDDDDRAPGHFGPGDARRVAVAHDHPVRRPPLRLRQPPNLVYDARERIDVFSHDEGSEANVV